MSEHELWNELGNLYFMSGAYNQAANAYQRSIQADTEFGRPYSNLALTYVQQGKYDEAIELYRRSIELLADNTEKAISLNRLGSVYRHLKDYSQAVVAFQEADELDPRSTDEFPPSAEPRARTKSILSSVLDEPVSDIVYERVETITEVSFTEPTEEVGAAAEPVTVEEPVAEITEQPVAEVIQEQVVAEAELPLLEMAEEPVALIAEEPVAASIEEPVAVEIEEPVAEVIEEPVAAELELPMEEVVFEPVAQVPEPQVEEVVFEPVAQVPETPDEDIIYEPDAGIEEASAALASDESQEEDTIERMTRRMNFLVGEALDQAVMTIADQQEASNEPETEPELEWWDVDEERFENATRSPETIEEPSTSWIPSDLSQFQQDVSQMPDTGSLTTWGDADFDDDFERWSPMDPYPDVETPDPDSENISKWLPIPEEAPLSMDLLRVPPFVDELDEESEPPSDWEDVVSGYHARDAGSLTPVLPTSVSKPAPMDTPVRSEPAVAQQKTWERHVDVAVEERPARDVNVVPQQRPSRVEVEPAPRPTQRELVLAPAPEVPSPVPCEPDRDETEMREIELGIEKFRRVVQLNPRNAHAWDALGTLYKSAGQYEDAIQAYQQAIANDSTKSLYYHHLGLVYACEHRDEDAIMAFQRVIEIDPEYSLAHATLGGYYRKMGLEELAQKHIGKAMKNIFDSENEYNRACLEAICGNTEHAIQLLDVALKNKQTYVDWILRDPDLDFIRQDPRFKQLISHYTR